jgi:hypothetical protein
VEGGWGGGEGYINGEGRRGELGAETKIEVSGEAVLKRMVYRFLLSDRRLVEGLKVKYSCDTCYEGGVCIYV